jgi:flagellar operon protein
MVVNNRFLSNIDKIQGNTNHSAVQRPVQQQAGFEKILQDKIQASAELKFSKHAEMRLQTRNILLSQAQKEKIGQAVSKAEAKGVKDSLIMVDNVALVVNVKSKTVITAVNSNELKDNVFTNIDGAVFA